MLILVGTIITMWSRLASMQANSFWITKTKCKAQIRLMALAENSDLYLACYHIVVYNLNPSQINDIQLTVGHYDSANMAKTSDRCQCFSITRIQFGIYFWYISPYLCQNSTSIPQHKHINEDYCSNYYSHSPIDHTEQPLHQVGQVRDLSVLIWEYRPVHGGQLGQALKGILGHVRVLSNLPVYLNKRRISFYHCF